MKASLLFWENLKTILNEWEFEVNPYGWWVANKEVNRKQCTIVWHINDLKILHEYPKVVDNIANKLSDRYGK